MALFTYDPSQMAIVFAGIPISGFADGAFLSVEQDEDSFSMQVGSDGDACRSKTSNKGHTITFTLGQWSLANDLLSALHAVDLASPNGDGIGPFLAKDLSGRTLIAAEKAWIQRQPASSWDREAQPREWTIRSNDVQLFHGGN